MLIEDIRDLLQDALRALEEPASPSSLKRAERYTDEANAALRELTDPPDPYKDMNLRPGLQWPGLNQGLGLPLTESTPIPEKPDV